MTTIGQTFRDLARATPQRTALVVPGSERALTLGQLELLAERLLDAAGGKPGAIIALHTSDRLAQVATIVAGLMAGCVICPVNPGVTDRVLAMLMGHARPRLLLSDGTARDALRSFGFEEQSPQVLLEGLGDRQGSAGVLPHCADGGLLVYTSGTTGDPKGVLLNERHIAANVAFAIEHFGYGPDWVTASVLPLFHTFTLISDVLPMLACGGRCVVTPGVALGDIKQTMKAFTDLEVRSYSGVPIIFDTFMALRVKLPDCVRFAVAGAAPLSERTQTRYLGTYGHPIIPCYGLSESTCFAAASSLEEIRPGAVGKPAAIEIDVVDESLTSVAPGTRGEVALRGASVLSDGYFQDGGKHSAAFTDGGWFLTGDLGHLDAEGYLHITGRRKNMLIRGGEKIYLEDVDRCLLAHDAVADACVIRVESTGAHEDRAVAFIVWSARPVDRPAIVDHVREALGPLSSPDEVVSIDEIPRSPSGKALREVLGAQYRSKR